MKITNAQAIRMLYKFRQEGKGKFFSVHFIKRSNGCYRKMNCRFGVKKNLVGTGPKYNFEEKGLMSVFDVQKCEYRVISLESIRRIRINHKVFKICEVAG
jgi:hypothetical protein